MDLSLHFEDPEGEALTFSASSADPAAVSASVAGHLLTVAAAAEGAVVVKVTATDAFGSPPAAAAFTVTAQPPVDELRLGDNSLTDVSPLASLAKLASLDLDGNRLTSIGGLTSNAGLGDGDRVSLEWNPLDARTLAEDVTALRERGVTVAVSEAPSGALGAPRDLRATAGDGALTLTWAAPPGPAKPVAYELRWRSVAEAVDDWTVVPCSSKRRHESTGLANGTTYTVEVRAAGAAS